MSLSTSDENRPAAVGRTRHEVMAPEELGVDAVLRWQARARARAMAVLADAHATGRALVWAATAGYLLLFSHLSITRYRRFDYPSFDLGIFDQGLWLLSRLREPFITLRGLNLFGDHSSYLMVLLAPVYWVWADTRLLLILTVAALAAGAPLLYAAGRALGVRPGLAAAVAVTYLAYPAIQWNAWDNFHPEVFVVPLLIASFLLVARGQPWWAVLPVAIALTAKEDVALIVVPFGIWVAWRLRAPRQGLSMAGLGIGAFLLNFLVLLPHFSPTGSPVYAGRYSKYGDSALGIVWGVLTDPRSVAADLWNGGIVGYLEQMVVSVPTALFAPLAVLMGGPITVANFLSEHTYQTDFHFHYSAYLAAAVAVAAVVGAKWLQARFGSRYYRLLVGAVLAVAALYVGSGPGLEGPWGNPARPHPDVVEALSLIGDRDPVAAGPYLTGHLSHRPEVYEFPNPFARRNYSAPGILYAPPAEQVQWVIVETGRTALDGFAGESIQALLGSGEWDIVRSTEEVLLLQRR